MSNTHIEPLLVVNRPLPETVSSHTTRESDGQPAFEQHLSLAGGAADSKQKQERPTRAHAGHDEAAHSESQSEARVLPGGEGARRTGSHPANESHDEVLSHQSVSIPQIAIQPVSDEVAVTSLAIASDESEPTDADAAAKAEQIVLANNEGAVAVHVEVVVNDEALLSSQADEGAQSNSRESRPSRQGNLGLDRATTASKEAAAATPTAEFPTATDSDDSSSHQSESEEKQPTHEARRSDARGIDSPHEPIEPTSRLPGASSREPTPAATEAEEKSQASGKAESNGTVQATAQRERRVLHDAEPELAITETSTATDERDAKAKGDKAVVAQAVAPAAVERANRSPSNTPRAAKSAVVQPAREGRALDETGEIEPDNVQLRVDRTSLAKAVPATAEAEPPPAPNGPPNAVIARDISLLTSGGRAQMEQELPKVDVDRFLGRVTRAFHTAQQRGGLLQLRLSPPELGSLRLEITITDGAMSASIETETAAARRILLDNLPALRERLAEQNVRIDRFDVDVRRDDGGGQTELGPRHDRRQSKASAPQRRSVRPAAPSDDATTPPTAPRSISTTRINVVA